MKLKDGKRYETADGRVFKVRVYDDALGYFEVEYGDPNLWMADGTGVGNASLIRRHYKKPQPAHKLDLKPGDEVELVAWEDEMGGGIRKKYEVDESGPYSDMWEFHQKKGHRPLFKVVSRA